MKVIFAVMNTDYAVVKIRPEKNSGLYRIWTYDLYDTGAVLYQLIWTHLGWAILPYFHYCSSSVYYSDDCFHAHFLNRSSHIHDFHIFTVINKYSVSIFFQPLPLIPPWPSLPFLGFLRMVILGFFTYGHSWFFYVWSFTILVNRFHP